MNLKNKMNFRKAVFVVCYRKTGKGIMYLVLKRRLHWKGWEFPKGGLKEKERIFAGVKREVKEETGQRAFNVVGHKEKGKYKYKKVYSDMPGYQGQSWRLFSAELKKERIKIDRKEHLEYRWLSFKEAFKILRFGSQKKCLKVVDKFLKE